MRIVSEYTEYEILSLVHAIKKDRNSWENWRCLRIETQALCATSQKNNLASSIRRILEIYLKDRHGTAYLSGFEAIHIFCKNVPKSILKNMGKQIQELIAQEIGEITSFSYFDIFRDHERFIEAYNYQVPVCSNSHSLAQTNHDDLIVLPDISDENGKIHDKKVLLVEDDPVTRWMVRTTLKGECMLATAQDAGKALSVFKSYKPDVVLLDINLPDRDGHELMMRIIHADPGAYIVMFSSHDTLENIVSTIEEGAQGFIAKPFSREKLLHYVHECPHHR